MWRSVGTLLGNTLRNLLHFIMVNDCDSSGECKWLIGYRHRILLSTVLTGMRPDF